MKKLTLLFVAVACLCLENANAQEGKGSINFVPYVGINNSDFSGDADCYFGETSGKLSLMAGIRFEFQILEKSAIIADVNYRRLGATTGNAIRWDSAFRFPIGENKYFLNDVGESHPSGEARGNYNKEEIFRIIKEADAGYVHEYTKVTLDCISLAVQFKQHIIRGLSARVGLEGIVSLAEKWHYHFYNYYKETEECIEGDSSSDIGGYFSDHINAAIPLGLTYDCNNFSINATYHLPITKCNGDKNPDFSNQAFDLTIGYRLPLRKR